MRKLFVISALIMLGCAILMAQKTDETTATVFEDVTKSVGLELSKGQARHIAWGDYNNDGWLDIFVSNYRLNPDFLWKNNGNGTFTNVAREVGVEGKPVNNAYGHTIGAEWADYDNDGNLDLFQANLAHPRYITFSNMSYLLHNNGLSAVTNTAQAGAPDYHFTECRKDSLCFKCC